MFHNHQQAGARVEGHGTNRHHPWRARPRLIAKPSSASVQMGRCSQETGLKYVIAFA